MQHSAGGGLTAPQCRLATAVPCALIAPYGKLGVCTTSKMRQSVPRGHGHPHIENRHLKQEAIQFVWQILKLPFSSWAG